jgi:hypothetical protein
MTVVLDRRKRERRMDALTIDPDRRQRERRSGPAGSWDSLGYVIVAVPSASAPTPPRPSAVFPIVLHAPRASRRE